MKVYDEDGKLVVDFNELDGEDLETAAQAREEELNRQIIALKRDLKALQKLR